MARTRVADGTAILACRERLGIKQRDLAARIGVSGSYLSRIETGIENPGMVTATVHKLAAALGTSLEAITRPAPEMEPEPEAVA